MGKEITGRDSEEFTDILQRKPRRNLFAPGFYFGIGIQAAAALHPKATISCDLPAAAANRHCTWVPGAKQNRKHPPAAEPNAGRKEGRKAVLTILGKGKPSSEKAPFPSVTPPLSRPVHENQPVCPASGSASNSNNWPSVFLPNATFALLMMRQGTLMILYRSRSSGKWFTS